MRVAAALVSLSVIAALFAPAAHARQTAPPPQEQPPQPPAPPDDMPEQADQNAPAPTPKTITIGEFLVHVATALKLQAPQGGFNPESASFALRGKGVQIDTAPTAMLTEADTVKVLDGLGYRVVTKTPSRTVNDQQAKLLIETFLIVKPTNPS